MTTAFDLVVKRGNVVLRDEIRLLDIGIRSGKIVALADSIDAANGPLIDATGQYVLPGMIDVHVHFNEPGLGEWEGFESGSAALAAGGCTTYADMPLNGVPPTINAEAWRQKLDAAHAKSVVDYVFWGGLQTGNIAELEGLAACGVIGFKAFMSSPGGEGDNIFREADDITLYEGMKKIAELGGILALHAESEPIVSKLAADKIAEGRLSARDYAASRPIMAELEAVNRALFYAKETGCALHFVHISSPQAVEVIDLAKKSGMNVTLETCPHYLTLVAEDMQRLGPVAKCAPPLRGLEEQNRLWTLLREGRIDMITSDHSPCPYRLKMNENENFFAAWGGISGAQSSMELMIDEGCLRRGIPLTQISRMLSYEPAKRFGLLPQKGEITLQADADLVFVDLNTSYILKQEDLLYRHPHSPYIGRTFGCRVTSTLCRGNIVYEAGRGILQTGLGQWLSQQHEVYVQTE
jgi:allantoinase